MMCHTASSVTFCMAWDEQVQALSIPHQLIIAELLLETAVRLVL